MGAFYGKKIRDGVTNSKTGDAWKIEDVPAYWKSKVEAWLEEN